MSAARGPVAEIVLMTPEHAREILASNTRNRPVRQTYATQLAEAIRRGEWKLNGEPIQIAVDGTLLNGQHRLLGVDQADLPIEMLVVRNLPMTAQDTIDTGATRRLSDILARRREVNSITLAAVLGLLHRRRTGAPMNNSGQTSPTHQQALELLDAEPDVRESVRMGHKIRSKTKMSATVASITYHLLKDVEPEETEEFFRLLMSDEKLPADNPVQRLKGILKRIQTDAAYHPTTYMMCAMTIKAFNAWCRGQSMAQLSFRPAGVAAEAFPEVERIT